jgi:TetR/AcrR family fatty acid metabolism transcriptional regulator
MELARSAKTRDEVLRDFRTQEILDAARHVIAEVGLAEASVERIAQEAGIAKGTLYLYFKNRETLLAAACEEVLATLLRRSRGAIQRTRGARQKLAEVVRVSLEHAAEHRAFLRALQQEEWGAGPQAEQLRERLAAYRRLVVGVIERGVRAHEFRSVDARWAGRALVESIRVAMLDEIQPPQPMSLEDKTQSIVDLFVHGIGTGDRP